MWMTIVCALYGLKSTQAPSRAHFTNTLQAMVFKTTFPDRDVWMCKKFLPLPQQLNDSGGSRTGTDTTALQLVPNPSNYVPTSSTPYYDYICNWVDDSLTVSNDATSKMQEIVSV